MRRKLKLAVEKKKIGIQEYENESQLHFATHKQHTIPPTSIIFFPTSSGVCLFISQSSSAVVSSLPIRRTRVESRSIGERAARLHANEIVKKHK